MFDVLFLMFQIIRIMNLWYLWSYFFYPIAKKKNCG